MIYREAKILLFLLFAMVVALLPEEFTAKNLRDSIYATPHLKSTVAELVRNINGLIESKRRFYLQSLQPGSSIFDRSPIIIHPAACVSELPNNGLQCDPKLFNLISGELKKRGFTVRIVERESLNAVNEIGNSTYVISVSMEI